MCISTACGSAELARSIDPRLVFEPRVRDIEDCLRTLLSLSQAEIASLREKCEASIAPYTIDNGAKILSTIVSEERANERSNGRLIRIMGKFMRYEHPQAARWSKVSALTSDDGPRPLLLGPIVSFLSANWLGLALWAVIGLSLTATYVMRAEPTYRSRAVIILDYRLPGSDGRVPSDSADSAYIDTQIKIIESNDVLLKVVDELALDKDPEFVSVKSGLSSKLAAWRSSLEQMIFAARMPPQDTTSSAEAIPADELRQIAARQLWSAMRASRAGRSYVAEIEVTANSSEKSARIANAIARTYVDYQWKFRMEATERESAPLARILTPASPLVERTGMKTPVLLRSASLPDWGSESASPPPVSR
ncbi:hypothetical protein AJ87_47640 [Rhizobium yanglingense]|nr:hypothetical protein AJ87_47640 [Rhizobium yanglingense]